MEANDPAAAAPPVVLPLSRISYTAEIVDASRVEHAPSPAAAAAAQRTSGRRCSVLRFSGVGAGDGRRKSFGPINVSLKRGALDAAKEPAHAHAVSTATTALSGVALRPPWLHSKCLVPRY
jgi:hypothetical protein